MHDLLIESCLPGTFDINTIYLTKLLLFARDNDKELPDMHTFNFDDYYLYVIYYPPVQSTAGGITGVTHNFLRPNFCFVLFCQNDGFIESWDDSLLLMFH